MTKIVLIRHGESVWNLENKFTGWTDVELSEKGVNEAKNAGKLLKEKGFCFDVAFTSFLKRAQNTLNLILNEMECHPQIIKSWRLNERHYGALQGLNKKETAEKYGEENVHQWRRSADVRPPLLREDDPRSPRNDAKYKDVESSLLPLGENLIDTAERVKPIFEGEIKKAINDRKSIIIAAHGNSLRALIMILEHLSAQEIISVEIPTGKPLIYEIDEEFNVKNKYYL